MPNGHQFWINQGGRARCFVVAVPDYYAAQALLQERLPDAHVMSWHLIEGRVMQELTISPGDITEWLPGPESGPPTPRGTPT